MENIKLSSRDKPGHHRRSIGNPHVLLPSHQQTSHHRHWQRLTLTIGTNASPLLDLVTFSCLFIGNHPHRQLPGRPVTVAPSCRSILYRSLGTCPKTVSTQGLRSEGELRSTAQRVLRHLGHQGLLPQPRGLLTVFNAHI